MNALLLAGTSFVRRVLHPIALSTVAILALLGVLMTGSVLRAQTKPSAGRAGLISQAVNETDRLVLRGNTHPLATRAADRGPVAASAPAERLLLLLQRSPEQELALRAAIQSMHDSNSPNFHKWLTPQQFGESWGATDSDVARVTAWLQSHGFTVQPPMAGRTAIEFSGTVGQVQEAFHTSIHNFMVNGVMHHANVSDPQIPAALAPVVAGIATLNDFHPHALAKPGPRGTYDAKTHKIRPDLTFTGAYDFLYVGPSDAATIYNTPNKALNPAYSGATVDGTGSVIGIIGDSNVSTSQILNYQRLFGLSQKAPTVIIDGGADPGINGDAVEAYLDLEVAGGIAPGAKVYMYTAADTLLNFGLDLAIFRAVNDNIADVLNVSFGACEGGLGTASNRAYELGWEQAAAQGISVTVSTGDSGAAGCDNSNTETAAFYGLQVNGLASTPFNVAVGGTDFGVLAGPDGSGKDFPNYVSLVNSPGTLRSAKGYIPEVPWNDSVGLFPISTISTNFPYIDSFGNTNIAGGSGGKSNCAVGSYDPVAGTLSCQYGYPKPSWQSAPGVPADKARDLPDVSLFASNGFDYATWGICIDSDTDSQGNPIVDCVPGAGGNFNVFGVGGTSAAAPAFAGVLALVKQSTGERLGQADYVLYNLARKSPAIFHDVTTGNISVPCQTGSTDCTTNAAGFDFLTGYDAGAGYDLATGLGSVDVAALVAGWSSAGLATSTTTLSLTPTSIEHGEVVVADVTVTAGKGTATGDVALVAKANPPGFPLTESINILALKSGGTTGSVDLNYLPGGSYSVIATYGGSPELTQSVSAPQPVTVTPESSSTGLLLLDSSTSAVVTNGSMPYGQILALLAQPYGNRSPMVGGKVQPDGTATGKLTFGIDGKSLATQTLSAGGAAYYPSILISSGTHAITAAYSGDLSFKPSSDSSSLMVTKAPTTLAMTSSATKFDGTPIVFTISLSTNSAGVAPTGYVLLTSGTSTVASGMLVGVAGGATPASGSVTISTSNFATITEDVFAMYVGDGNYAASTSNGIQIKGRPGFTIASFSARIYSEHGARAFDMTTVSKGGYAGTINYSCVLITKTTTDTPAECAMDPGTATLPANRTVAPLLLVFGKGTKLPTGVTSGSNTSGNGRVPWLGAGGTVLFCCCLLFGIPARRRTWRAMLPLLLLLLAMVGGFTACVSQGKLITHGNYTFKVTGTDSKDLTNTASGIVTVEVL